MIKNILVFLTISLAIGLIHILFSEKVFAATCTWNGTVSSNWGTAANWNGDCGGTPQLGDDLVFPASSSYTMVNSISGLTVNSMTFSSGGAGSYALNGNAITVMDKITLTTGTIATINNIIGGTTVIKDGPGSLYFSGSLSNTINTSFNINDGIVLFAKVSGGISSSANIIVGDNIGSSQSAKLMMGEEEQLSNFNNLTINGQDGYVDLNGYNETIADLHINDGGQIDTNDGNLIITSLYIDSGKIDTAMGALTIDGNIYVDNHGVFGIISITGARLNLLSSITQVTIEREQFAAFTISSDIYGSGEIILNGILLGLSGDNSNFTGDIYVGSSGYPTILGVLGSNTALGDGSGKVTIADGSSLEFDSVVGTVDVAIDLQGNGIGEILGQDLGAIYVVNSVATVLGGNVTLLGDSRIITGTDGALTISGNISGEYGITFQGVGQENLGVLLNGTNTHEGLTSIVNTELHLQNGNAIFEDFASVYISSTGKLFVDSTENTAAIYGEGKIILAPGVLLSSAYYEGPVTFSGIIEGSGDFAKYGVGELILTNNSPGFTGYLYNWEGPLTVNGNISNATAANQGGEFGGNGTYGSMDGTFGITSPGNRNDIGTMNILGNFYTAALSTLYIQVTGANATSGNDLINVTGNVELIDVTLNLDAIASPLDGITYTIIKATGEITGTFVDFPNNSLINVGGKNLRLNYTKNAVTLTSPAILYVPTLSVSSTNEKFGKEISMFAQVAGSGLVPTGTVSFVDGSNVLAIFDLVNGEATYNVTTLPVGIHNMKIVYSGNNYYPRAESTVAIITISTEEKSETTAVVSYPVSFPTTTTKPTSSSDDNGEFANQNIANTETSNNLGNIIVGIFVVFLFIGGVFIVKYIKERKIGDDSL